MNLTADALDKSAIQQAPATTRFDALTGFRCLAASMVFIYHNRKYWRAKLHPEVLRLFNEFHIGVSLFFVLSGFLIAYTYADKPIHSVKKYSGYILIRLARIMPLYWLILTCYYFDPAFGNRQFSLQTYSLFHAFSDVHNLDGIAQAWSLNVEIVFYFFAPFLCLLQRKHLLLLIGFLVLLFCITWTGGELWHHINGNHERYFYPLKFVVENTFPGRCTEFLAGILMASAIKSKKANWLSFIPYKTWIGFAGIFITAYCIGFFQPDIFHHGTDTIPGGLIHMFILPIFVVIALTGLIQERTWLQKFFGSKLMIILGNASFAFYLVHISYINLKLQQYVHLPDRNFILLWIISILLYYIFEKNIYVICRKWLRPLTT